MKVFSVEIHTTTITDAVTTVEVTARNEDAAMEDAVELYENLDDQEKEYRTRINQSHTEIDYLDRIDVVCHIGSNSLDHIL